MRQQMMEEIRAQLSANQELMKDESQSSWDEQLRMARAETIVQESAQDAATREPHLVNLNEDAMLSGVLVHAITSSSFLVGRKDGNPVPQLCLNGLRLKLRYAIETIKFSVVL